MSNISSLSPIFDKRVEQINQVLPQTQCTKCGYPSCKDYAIALAQGRALHNQCPPGGKEGIRRLAQLLHQPILDVNPTHGVERERPVAVIDPQHCIGCTLCIQACPVDAIMGANKLMHTVIDDWCTGCDLCVEPCPVDCISMVSITPKQTGWDAWSGEQAQLSRTRYEQRQIRLSKEKEENDKRLLEKAEHKLALFNEASHLAELTHNSDNLEENERKKRSIAAAIARAKQKQQEQK